MLSFEHEDQDDTTSSPGPSVSAMRMSSQPKKKGQKDIADLANVHIEHLAYIIIAFAEVLKNYVIKAANAAIVKTRTRNTYITIDRKLLIIIDILFEYVICIQSCSFITLIIENIAFNFLQIISFK